MRLISILHASFAITCTLPLAMNVTLPYSTVPRNRRVLTIERPVTTWDMQHPCTRSFSSQSKDNWKPKCKYSRLFVITTTGKQWCQMPSQASNLEHPYHQTRTYIDHRTHRTPMDRPHITPYYELEAKYMLPRFVDFWSGKDTLHRNNPTDIAESLHVLVTLPTAKKLRTYSSWSIIIEHHDAQGGRTDGFLECVYVPMISSWLPFERGAETGFSGQQTPGMWPQRTNTPSSGPFRNLVKLRSWYSA
jgi:hypothetical protein